MFSLPPLPYAYNALEPHIDEETMKLHHDKHHAAYVNNLNEALNGQEEFLSLPIEQLLRDLTRVPESIRTKVRNNGGGHANHTMFWELLHPGGTKEPTGALLTAIKNKYSDFPTFKAQFSARALGRFGSGWVWVIASPDGSVEIVDTPNQDTPIMEGNKPILGLDVWEHAYYLRYQNKRADYVTAWWNIVNWDVVQTYYSAK